MEKVWFGDFATPMTGGTRDSSSGQLNRHIYTQERGSLRDASTQTRACACALMPPRYVKPRRMAFIPTAYCRSKRMGEPVLVRGPPRRDRCACARIPTERREDYDDETDFDPRTCKHFRFNGCISATQDVHKMGRSLGELYFTCTKIFMDI